MPSSFLLKKFGSLTEVQKQAMPLVAEGRNVLIIAPTGSGSGKEAHGTDRYAHSPLTLAARSLR